MEQITLGQIAMVVSFIVALITGLTFLLNRIKALIASAMTDEFRKINDRFAELENKIEQCSVCLNDIDSNATKNFLVRVLADIEQGQVLDSVEWARFWEQYDHYIKRGGNSYIREKVEFLKDRGLLNR